MVSESGSITSAHQHPIRSDERAERLVGTVASCIRSCLGGAARSARTVGVGLPGAGRGEGPVISPRPLAWQKVDLRSLIEKQVGL
ncbi:MAG TPA: hypothetical protein VMH90_03880, partial [Thermoplasmata archaeon]|nr:hypothetical protein [Thermoplasmata archaeon]